MNAQQTSGSRRLTCFVVLCGVLVFSVAANAATLQVNSTVDAVDASPGDGVCETATGNGICTLRAAIQEANANGANLNTIGLPAGTYHLTIAGSGEDAAATGDLDITSNISINGDTAATTIVDAGGIDRVFDIASAASVTFSRMTISGGGNVQNGGGIQNAGNLALISCIVANNGGNAAPVRFGAGIANLKILALTNSTVSNNQAEASTQSGAAGGGIYNVLAMTVEGSVISGNTAIGIGAAAGGVFSQDPAVTQIATTTISDNSALQGGGIEVVGGQLILTASTLSNNTASSTSGGGGALRMLGGSASLVNTTVSGNQAAGSGGGIAIGSGSVDLGNSTIANNLADSGGNGNGRGGGVQIASGATLTARNSIIAENHDASTSSAQTDCSGALTSQGYVLLQSSVGCTLATVTGDIINIDPQLAPLADNGGPTFTHAIIANSVAVDSGNPAGCTGYNNVPLITDQRGSSRPSDGNNDGTAECDIGAYELLSDIIFDNGFELQ